MRPEGEEWYIGIEAGRQWTQISCYHGGQSEPETKSTIAGAELYQIPTAICKRKQTGQWCFGEEGRKLAEAGEGYYAADLLKRAMSAETVSLDRDYSAEELLMVFFRKVLRLALPPQGIGAVTACVFSVEKVTEEAADFFRSLAQKLGFQEEQIQIQDHRESFYAYAVSQEPALWQQQVLLFEEEGEGVCCRLLSCDRRTKPKVSQVEETFLGKLPEEAEKRDCVFAGMVKQVLTGRLVSSVYLIGSGFEGGWMKEALQLVCRGRRAFQGKNLYTKGACYAGMLQKHQDQAETVYFCEYKLKEHVSIKITSGNGSFFYPLLEAGCNRHQVQKDFRILLEGEPVLELWIQKPGSREARIESLELPGLLVSDQERSRLSVSVFLGEEERIFLRLRDLGWGAMRPGTGLEWEYEIGKE